MKIKNLEQELRHHLDYCMKIELIKAFTNNPEQGNPAGVIFNADELSQEEMIKIASELGYSESVFIVKPLSDEADVRFRFMTATTEVDACGHATLAGAQAISEKNPFQTLRVETVAGLVTVERDTEGSLMMKMAKAELGDKVYDKETIARLLNIDSNLILDTPIKTASVGSSKLMIHIKNLGTIASISPDFEAMIEFCKVNPVKGFYVFTTETINLKAQFHTRQFNPAAGILEDPTTGVAGGALALYAQAYNLVSSDEILIEQGYELNKPGEIIIRIRDGAVYVGGNAVKFGTKEL